MFSSKNSIPYSKQTIDEDDVAAVINVLKSDWLTTGPMVTRFETEIAHFTGASFGVAVSSGTAALHAAMFAIDIKAGDEVIVPSLTFAATANAVVYQGGTPVFADIEPHSFLIDPTSVASKISPRTKAIIAVDYAGNPCDYDALNRLAKKNNLILVSDACHSLGGKYKDRKVGTLADLSVFSFHPAKHITTAEGGMITTNNENFARRIKTFRNHGITTDHRERAEKGTCHYEMIELGYNYRLNDIQCALGVSQLKKLPAWIERRNAIAHSYTNAFNKVPYLELQKPQEQSLHAHHLYVIRLNGKIISQSRDQVLALMKQRGIGANVHYPPVHLHPYYVENFQTKRGQLPVTESVYEGIISLPMYPSMTEEDVSRVVDAVTSL